MTATSTPKARTPMVPGPVPVLAVVGVGLIGGSFAQALREAGAVEQVLGVGRNTASLEEARALGLIDEIATLASAAARADVILLATPVAALGPTLSAMLPHLRAGAILTDAGSTKQDVVAAARDALGERVGCFVPGHPIAGSHASGPAAAHAGLYRGRDVVLAPLPENADADVARVQALWETCGATVRRLDPATHDSVFAAVSHLPHWLAAAYMAQIALSDDAALRLGLAGTGFRDFTRIAGGSPEMWRDIFLSNKTAMLRELDALRAVLERAEHALRDEDGEALRQWLTLASDARRNWQENLR